MEIHDAVNGKESGLSGAEPSAAVPKRISIDRMEFQRQWVQQEEEQQVEEALNLYAKAARQRMQSVVPESTESEEEREAKSQQLKLQQKCQDIAALMLVDELEEEEE